MRVLMLSFKKQRPATNNASNTPAATSNNNGITYFSFAAETTINAFFIAAFLLTAFALLFVLRRIRSTLRAQYPRAMVCAILPWKFVSVPLC